MKQKCKSLLYSFAAVDNENKKQSMICHLLVITDLLINLLNQSIVIKNGMLVCILMDFVAIRHGYLHCNAVAM